MRRKQRRIIPSILLIVGVALIGFSLYIKEEVSSGKVKVSNAQGSLDKGKSLFANDPFTRAIGQGVASGAQSKIDAGQAQINYYEKLASNLMIAGIACVVLGSGIFLFMCKGKGK